MNEIRIGVSGLGHRGRWWVHQLQRIPGYRIVAVHDRIEPLHELALNEIKNRADVKRFTNYSEFVNHPGMDAVALCVRSPGQGAMAAEALNAGKHVNAEVPAAHSIDDCWKIVLAAERSGKVYQLAEQVRYAGFVDAWRKLVAEGQLGKMTYAEGQYLGYYGTRQFFQNPRTGSFHTVAELAANPEAKPTWLHEMPPIHYVVHDLSPIMKILDDRPVQVVGMGTRSPSYHHPEIGQSDIQVALVKMERDTVVRLATGFASPGPNDDHHWWRFIGTRGRVEWRRRQSEKPVYWAADSQMHEYGEVDWRFQRTDAPDAAHGSGHSDLDYYVHATFREAVLRGAPVELGPYAAAEIAAVGILAADSIDRDSQPQRVPDFRPGPNRKPGQPPA